MRESGIVRAMKPAEKATRIGEQLDALYPAPPIPLDHTDPFTLLIAVMLSAQTTDKKVNQVTPALFEAGPTPKAMAALSAERILELIKEVGLAPTKAKNVKRTAELLVERHAGVVPRTLDELEALPGVGHKTAQVVLAQAFEIPAFPVDTHIHRLAERWGLSSGKNVDTTEKDLKAFFPEDTWIRRHLQIIYFGREHCPARGHDPKVCPICSWAAPKDATSSDTTKAAPKPAKAKKAGANESAERAAPKKNTKKSAERAEPKKATKKSAESAAPKKTAKKASKATTAKSAGRKSS